jgi:hypothetical protein
VTSTPVLQVKQEWRAAARAVGTHLQNCEICQPRPGGRAVRNACAEYVRLDATENAAWAAYEQAREAQA